MKKIILTIILLISIFAANVARADSSFLPSFDFVFLYRDHPVITETRKAGISSDEYLNFLLSDSNTLGEKVALIEALASYFEFMDDENKPKGFRDYFPDYTRAFKQKTAAIKPLPPELQLLETLMNDYRTEKPNIKRYNALAESMPQSLTAQSIRVIAFAYNIVYNHLKKLEWKYRNEYLYPYQKAWKSYKQDIHPDAYKYVMSWREYIVTSKLDESGLYGWTLPEDEPVRETTDNEDGTQTTIMKTVSGLNLKKNVYKPDEWSIDYRWDEETEEWKLFRKTEEQYDKYEHPLFSILYQWDNEKNVWKEKEKQSNELTYNDAEKLTYYIQQSYEWKYGDWAETERTEYAVSDDGKSNLIKHYIADDYGRLYLYETEAGIREGQEIEYLDDKQETQEEEYIEIEEAIELPPINERFTACFPDMIFGEYVFDESPKPVPQQMVAEFLPDFIKEAEKANAKIHLYAVGKILNYKGLDLYICDCDYERPDEDSYDNHTDNIRFMLLFKNNIPLKEYSARMVNGMNFHYYGEGGENNSSTYFDTDTTLICHQHLLERESATGYNTPFISTKKWRSVLYGDGVRETVEILQMEYSSPFYDCKYLKEKEKEWKNIDADDFNQTYPTENEKWFLISDKIPVYCAFHIEKTDTIEEVQFLPVFESYYGYDLIDRYIIGQPHSPILSESVDIPKTTILKCPIIIKTSDGDLELLPDGKFRLADKK